MKEFTIGKNDAGQRLDRFLAKAVPLLPASLAQKYIRIKRIKCNGKRIDRDTRLQEGDVLQLYINDEFFDKPREDNAYLTVANPKLSIVYEDENILLVDKRPGLAVHPHDGAEYGRTLIDHIQSYLYQKREWRPREENAFTPALCNRIDRNTGGIVIAAKTAEALRVMNQKIKDREIDKRYLAIVEGSPKPKEGSLKGYLFKDAQKNRVYVTDTPQPGSKTCQTNYNTLATAAGLSLVECELITGPSHAEEVCINLPTGLLAASTDQALAEFVQDAFMADTLRVYTSPDPVGAELGAALKNVIALCAGITDGLGFGDNAKAMLMTRGLTETARLGVALGAKKETFAGLAGVGDLIVTCTSMHSRNRRAGILIGQGKDPQTAMKEVGAVVEGYYAAKSAYELGKAKGIDMPITDAAYKVLYEGADVKDAVQALLSRQRKSESEDAGWQ